MTSVKPASSPRRPRASRWWSSTGDEECPHCGHAYPYGAEYRCAGCDAPSCLHCIVARDGERYCPDCAPAAEPR